MNIYVYLGIELLCFMVSICVALEETESSKVFVLFCILTSNILIFCCAISLSMLGIAVGFHFSDFRASLVTQLVKIPPAIQETHLIPGSARSAGEGICYPLQFLGLKNSMDCIVHGVTKSQT